MLYVTTRIGEDAFTANRALSENRGPAGGFFVPIRLPVFGPSQIAELVENSFSQNVAHILNLFFGSGLDSWDVELVIGRYPVKLIGLTRKTIAAKTWCNPQCRFDRLVSGLEKLLRHNDVNSPCPSDWLQISSRIAVLFGICGMLLRKGVLSEYQKIDVAVPSKDLTLLMAVWYAREMGLPVGRIICCCNENNGLWNLLHKGELRTDSIAERTCTPDCDFTVPPGLERLIFAVSDHKEVVRFCEICRKGGTYSLRPDMMESICDKMHVSVVSEKRISETIPNLYKTMGYLADPYTALSYCGLADYRVSTGSHQPAILIAEESPLFSLEFVSRCMNMLPGELKERLN